MGRPRKNPQPQESTPSIAIINNIQNSTTTKKRVSKLRFGEQVTDTPTDTTKRAHQKGIVTRSKAISQPQQPVVLTQHPLAFSQQPIALSQQPVAFNQQPVAFNQQPVAFSQQPVASTAPQQVSSAISFHVTVKGGTKRYKCYTVSFKLHVLKYLSKNNNNVTHASRHFNIERKLIRN